MIVGERFIDAGIRVIQRWQEQLECVRDLTGETQSGLHLLQFNLPVLFIDRTDGIIEEIQIDKPRRPPQSLQTFAEKVKVRESIWILILVQFSNSPWTGLTWPYPLSTILTYSATNLRMSRCAEPNVAGSRSSSQTKSLRRMVFAFSRSLNAISVEIRQ